MGTEIDYVRGDATTPLGKGPEVIAHVCNDLGGWGKGFVLAISRRWPEPEAAYRRWHRERAGNDFALGAVQIIQVDRLLWVANMIGQHGMRTGSKGVPVRYDAIDTALGTVATRATELNASVRMPRIGCGLAGGKWERIEPLDNPCVIPYFALPLGRRVLLVGQGGGRSGDPALAVRAAASGAPPR